jgi:TetR/AcrR family transcriptional regulator
MARSKALNERMRDERRAQILSVALGLFAAKGLAATRIADISAGAGISQGLLYHYFRTKEAIYVELIRTAFEGMNEATRALERLPLSPRQKIRKAVVELLRLMATDEDFARYFMLTAQASLSAAVPDQAKDIIRKQRGLPYLVIANIMRAGQRDGTVRRHHAGELAAAFWIMIKGLAMHRAAFGKKFKAPDPDLLMHLFLVEGRA